MFDKCPGAGDIRTPTITIKTCPECNGYCGCFGLVHIVKEAMENSKKKIPVENVIITIK